MHVPFTIAFLCLESQVLMLQRLKPPWQGLWNGVGGKILPGEEPMTAMTREVFEETGIELNRNDQVFYSGIVTWDTQAGELEGMHAYVVELASTRKPWREERHTREGLLGWQPWDWAITVGNSEVAANIPLFLPQMCASHTPHRYHCHFDQLTCLSVIQSELE